MALDHRLVLVRRERAATTCHEQPSKSGEAKYSSAISSMCARARRAELLVLRDLEERVGELAVLHELLLVRRDRRGRRRRSSRACSARSHSAVGRRAERAPLDERLHRPREVVVQRRQRDVRRRVRVVDRMHLAALDERLARVELPAEERVHEPRDRHDLAPDLRRQEIVLHRVALVHRRVRAEVQRHRLGADRKRAHEDVEAVDCGLQVHQALAGLVVAAPAARRAELTRVTPTHWPPSNGFMYSG